MKKSKKILSQLQVLVMPHAIVTYVAIFVAIVLIFFSKAFYEDDPFVSSVFMGIATGVISGIVLLVVAGIKNTWLYMIEERMKWLDTIHNEILSYMNKEKAYPRFSQEASLEECYNYVYDFGLILTLGLVKPNLVRFYHLIQINTF